MRVALQSLYETLLIGASPCHGFTKVPGQTGGFYHLVLRHGVSVHVYRGPLSSNIFSVYFFLEVLFYVSKNIYK